MGLERLIAPFIVVAALSAYPSSARAEGLGKVDCPNPDEISPKTSVCIDGKPECCAPLEVYCKDAGKKIPSVCKPNFIYGPWGKCTEEKGKGVQRRKLLKDKNDCGKDNLAKTVRGCKLSKPACTPDWQYGPWGECSGPARDGKYYQSRSAKDKNKCGVALATKDVLRECTPKKPACTPDWEVKPVGECRDVKDPSGRGRISLEAVDKNKCGIPYTGPTFQLCDLPGEGSGEPGSSTVYSGAGRLGFRLLRNSTTDSQGNTWYFEGASPRASAAATFKINDTWGIALLVDGSGEIFYTASKGGDGHSWNLEPGLAFLINNDEVTAALRAQYTHDDRTFNFKGSSYRDVTNGARVSVDADSRLIKTDGTDKKHGLELPFAGNVSIFGLNKTGLAEKVEWIVRLGGELAYVYNSGADGKFTFGVGPQWNADYSRFNSDLQYGLSLNGLFRWTLGDLSLEARGGGKVPGTGNYERYDASLGVSIPAGRVLVIPRFTYAKETIPGDLKTSNDAFMLTLDLLGIRDNRLLFQPDRSNYGR